MKNGMHYPDKKSDNSKDMGYSGGSVESGLSHNEYFDPGKSGPDYTYKQQRPKPEGSNRKAKKATDYAGGKGHAGKGGYGGMSGHKKGGMDY